MLEFEEWYFQNKQKHWPETNQLVDGIFDFDGIKYLREVPTVNTLMMGAAVDMFKGTNLMALSRITANLKEIGDYLSNINGTVFLYQLFFYPGMPQYYELDLETLNHKRLLDENGNLTYKFTKGNWLLRYGVIENVE